MDNLIKLIDNTLQKSLLQDFRNYLKLNPYNKFSIYSDYCFDDENKPNDVASFTIAPSWTAFPEIIEEIQKLIPTDIKNRSSISMETVKILQSKYFFHMNFVLRKEYIREEYINLSLKNLANQDTALKFLDEMIQMIEVWIINQPEGKDKFLEQKKKFSKWRLELSKKSPSLNLYRQIIFVSILASYIAHMLTIEAKADTIIWFSDRDKIINAYDKVAFDFFEISHLSLCDYKGKDALITKLGIGIEDEGINELWYDPLIRIPDHLAGALSSWDISVNRVSKNKQAEILQKIFTENNFCTIIELNLNKNKFSCGREIPTLSYSENN